MRHPTGPFKHDGNLQAYEGDGFILIAVVDETYGNSEGEAWKRDRERLRVTLEEEFGLRFEDGNIGPGADLPAFLTLFSTNVEVPAWMLIASIFFAGKPVSENLEVWSNLARKIRTFFKRPVYLNRQGAAVIAIEALLETLGYTPAKLRLLSYRPLQSGDGLGLSSVGRSEEISEPVATLHLGFVHHVFDVEADGELFRIGVDGRQATVLHLTA